MNKILKQAKENMVAKEKLLSEYACKSEKGIWLKEDKEDIRPIFYRDIDRIIHSSGYARYIDKTQVYSFVQNDHITRRVLHVQLVSKIARTIGRSLLLNEDLIEAIALGHDVGHSPFGHKGESLLNEICKKEKIGCFCHNAQSVRVLESIDKLNISVQTLDGILAHNGEILINKYEYNPEKTKEDFKNDLEEAFMIEDYSKSIIPMTLEASVVRVSDVIAYIGRDIEDAITLKVIQRKDIPSKIKEILGDNNSQIVDTLIKDMIINSFNKPYLCFSEEIFDVLMELKQWNYKIIYNSKMVNEQYKDIEEYFEKLYYNYLNEIKENKNVNTELCNFANKMSKEEKELKRIIIDYIAGQTDNYFIKESQEL